LGNDFGEAVGETIEEAAMGSFWECAAEHFHDVLGGLQGLEDTCGVKTGWSSEGCWRGWDKISRVSPCQPILALQVGLGDLQVV